MADTAVSAAWAPVSPIVEGWGALASVQFRVGGALALPTHWNHAFSRPIRMRLPDLVREVAAQLC